MDSAVGLSLITRYLRSSGSSSPGFHDVDRYFCETPLEKNVVALMGLINVWYTDFFGAESHADAFRITNYLHLSGLALQQLTMESNQRSPRAGDGM